MATTSNILLMSNVEREKFISEWLVHFSPVWNISRLRQQLMSVRIESVVRA